MSCCTDRRFVVAQTLPAIVPRRRDPGGRTCQMTFAGAPLTCLTAVAPAYVERIVMGVEVAAAASTLDRPCSDSDSVDGKDRSFRVGRAGPAGSFARGRRRFWASYECAGKGPVACPG